MGCLSRLIGGMTWVTDMHMSETAAVTQLEDMMTPLANTRLSIGTDEWR
ncbi:unnamed protein product [Rodentolepis nana]|uniref:DDE_Tnp_ISL3 domain-containing protein n=1 Tax=Rodentolepis nana TaxID=102285 RepID=A0A0R3TWL9_RODNA|nr:unnamed protein product [Rodentolepis nana]